MIELKITGDDVDAFRAQWRKLVEWDKEMSTPVAPPPSTADLNAMIDTLRAAGFDVINATQKPLSLPESAAAAEEPAKGKKSKGRPPLVDTETAQKRLKGNGDGADIPGSPPQQESDPETDRQHVLAVLSKLFNNPGHKAKVTEFSAKMSQEHGGGEKLSMLPTDKFPAIRTEMEKTFGADAA
jgi:hypothetical protein